MKKRSHKKEKVTHHICRLVESRSEAPFGGATGGATGSSAGGAAGGQLGDPACFIECTHFGLIPEEDSERKGTLDRLMSSWDEAIEKKAFIGDLARQGQHSHEEFYFKQAGVTTSADSLLQLFQNCFRARVTRFVWRLAAGNMCALCFEKCTDDTFELAHVHQDGREEQTRQRGAGNVGLRQMYTREYGMHLLKQGKVVLLCPNDHWRYDKGSGSSIQAGEVARIYGTPWDAH